MNLYLTADRIGIETGGGKVTGKEFQAFQELGPTQVIDRDTLESSANVNLQEPWKWDQLAYRLIRDDIKLAHIYSGTFSDTVCKLKKNGAKVVYTIAAHDRQKSREAHEK